MASGCNARHRRRPAKDTGQGEQLESKIITTVRRHDEICRGVWPRQIDSIPSSLALNSFHCPAGVFGNQRLGIFGGLLQVGQGGRRRGIAQRDADVPEAGRVVLSAKPACRRSVILKPASSSCSNSIKFGRSQVRSRMFLHQPAFAREPVPRTRRQASRHSQKIRFPMAGRSSTGMEPFQLDGEIGNAEPGVELERRGDGAASGQASMPARAVAAVIFSDAVRFQVSSDVTISASQNPVGQTAG